MIVLTASTHRSSSNKGKLPTGDILRTYSRSIQQVPIQNNQVHLGLTYSVILMMMQCETVQDIQTAKRRRRMRMPYRSINTFPHIPVWAKQR